MWDAPARSLVHQRALRQTRSNISFSDILCARRVLSPHHLPHSYSVQSVAVDFCSFPYTFYPYTQHGPSLLQFLLLLFCFLLSLLSNFAFVTQLIAFTLFGLYLYWVLPLTTHAFSFENATVSNGMKMDTVRYSVLWSKLQLLSENTACGHIGGKTNVPREQKGT